MCLLFHYISAFSVIPFLSLFVYDSLLFTLQLLGCDLPHPGSLEDVDKHLFDQLKSLEDEDRITGQCDWVEVAGHFTDHPKKRLLVPETCAVIHFVLVSINLIQR